jgi:predicted phosphodiesterase
MRIALLSDVHGNLHALEAVLADLKAQGTFDKVWLLGDLCAFGARPTECLARLRDLRETLGKEVVSFIGGNTDRYLVRGERPKGKPAKDADALFALRQSVLERDIALNWGMSRLSYDDYAFLSELVGRELAHDVPTYGRVIGFHAIPGDDEPTHLRPDTPDDLAEDALLDRSGRLAVCGHTHLVMDRALTRWRVINPGSVGMSFSQHGYAEWAYITFENGDAQATFRALPYDADAVLRDAEAVGYPTMNTLLSALKKA